MKTVTPAGANELPEPNTPRNEANTLSLPKKLAQFSQNFQEISPLPARTEGSVTPTKPPNKVAPIIPKITEPLTLSLSSIAIIKRPTKHTAAFATLTS